MGTIAIANEREKIAPIQHFNLATPRCDTLDNASLFHFKRVRVVDDEAELRPTRETTVILIEADKEQIIVRHLKTSF